MSVRMESQAGTSIATESQPPSKWKPRTAPLTFDVFINHRGPDVKDTFVSHLYDALKGVGLRPFLDAKDIELCRVVDNSIDDALKGSCVHVAIFSERYAESKHCLNELCMMLGMGKLRKNILPVFYHVDPVDLRMKKDSPFKQGFRRLIERETELTNGQIMEWKKALSEISGRMGLLLDKVNGNEGKLVRRIVAEVRQSMSTDVLLGVEPVPGAETPGVGGIEEVESPQAETPEVGVFEGVESPEAEAEAEPEPVVTFNPGDRRLNILVLGDPESKEAVIGHLCGAGRQQTVVEGHVNLTESSISSPPMCLYTSDTQGINRMDSRDIRTFVKVRNKKWRRKKVKALWLKEVHECRGSRNWPDLFSHSPLRLHAIWVACGKLSDLPNLLKWPEITEKLCDLPVQILVVDQQSTDRNFEQEFNTILQHGSDFFPNAHESMEKLIVKVDLQADDLKGELWRKCWAVKTRVEIGNAAKIIRETGKKLGSAGKCVQRGLCARMRKEVFLSLTREFVYNFLCTYWDIPQDSLRRVLPSRTSSVPQARASESCQFVEFCLIVAAIILRYNCNAQDNSRRPNVTSESSLDQLLQTGARDCYDSYFAPSSNPRLESLDYDKMVFEDIRLFLERIFARQAVAPVDRNSAISRIMKLYCRR